MVPTLATARLVLSAPTAADLDAMYAMWSDPSVHQSLFARPPSREEIWHRLLRYIGHWAATGYGHWLVRVAGTGDYAGEVGLMDSRRATDPGFEGVPEAGWALGAGLRGRGYATEALAAMLAWADGRMPRTVCIIDPANTASLRLAERLGYIRWAEGAYRDRPTLFFERRAAFFEGSAALPSSQRRLGSSCVDAVRSERSEPSFRWDDEGTALP